MKYVHFSFILLLFTIRTVGQTNYYETSFGTTNIETFRSLKLGTDSTIYLAGFSNATASTNNNIVLAKLNYAGQVLWTKQITDTLYTAALYINTTNDNNFIICGETEYGPNNKDGFIIKLDTAGTIIWRKQFVLPNNQTLKYCMQTTTGHIITCGATNDSFGGYDNWLVKLSPNGTLIYSKTYGTATNEYADQVKETPEGNYLLTADVLTTATNSYDIELFKLDTAGNVIWDKIYGDELQNGCQGVLVTSTNNYLSYGESNVAKNLYFDFWIDLINPQGDTIWHKQFGGAYSDAVFGAVEVSDGFVFTGYSSSYNNGAPADVVVFKTDTLGNLLWQHTYGTIGVDIGYEIIKGIHNDFFVTGKYNVNNDDFYLLHIDANGLTISNTMFKTPAINAFPNPSTGEVFFTNTVKSIKVINALGEVVYYNNLLQCNSVNLSHLINGLYSVQLIDNSFKINTIQLSIIK